MLTNSGGCPLTVTSIVSSKATFQVASIFTLPLTIAPGDTYELPDPVRAGRVRPDSATIRIVSDDPASPAIVNLHAVCPPPRLVTVVADSGNAGHVCLGDFADIDIAVENSSECELVITSITSDSPEFLVPSVNGFPIELCCGSALELPIRFQPTINRAEVGDDHDRRQRPGFAAHRRGVGLRRPRHPARSPARPALARSIFGTRVQQRLTLNNVGDCDLHVTKVGFEGCRCPGCNTLKLVRNVFPATLHPGASLDLVLRVHGHRRVGLHAPPRHPQRRPRPSGGHDRRVGDDEDDPQRGAAGLDGQQATGAAGDADRPPVRRGHVRARRPRVLTGGRSPLPPIAIRRPDGR